MKNPWLWLILTFGWFWLAGRFFVEKYAPKTDAAPITIIEKTVVPDTVFLPVPMAESQPVFWEKTENGYRTFFLDNSEMPVVSPTAAGLLKNLAQKAVKNHQKVKLTGHTDEIGPDAVNFNLGHIRARAVRKVLADHGMAEDKITTDSEGEKMPLVPNVSEKNRQRNRRVELVFE